MKFNLTNLKKEILPVAIAATIILFLIILISVQQIFRSRKTAPSSQNLPPSTKLEPVKNGKFDTSAPISQKSNEAINLLRPHLPYRAIFTTTTGTQVTYAIRTISINPYTLYIETININFLLASSDPILAKNVEDFRETAGEIFKFMGQYNVNPSDVFISWANNKQAQDNAGAWLVVSDKFPSVVKKGNQFIFVNQPKQ